MRNEKWERNGKEMRNEWEGTKNRQSGKTIGFR